MADAQHRVDPPAPARGERARFWALLVLSVVLLAGSVLVVWALLGPGVQGALASQEADGVREFGVAGDVDLGSDLGPTFGAGADTQMSIIGSVATVRPESGWWVTPQAHGGLLLRSPDRVLVVDIGVVTEAEARVALDLAGADGDPLRTETLASGARVQHVTGDGDFAAVLKLGGADLLVEAEVTPGGDHAGYRPALGALLESVALPAN